MKQILIPCVIVLLLAPSAAAAGQARDFPDNLTFTTSDGRTIDSAALKAAPLVLVVGASWCPECRQEAPEVQKAYLQYREKGVQFLSILGHTSDEDMKDFIQTYRCTYPVAKDNGIVGLLGVRVIPQVFFFHKGGALSKRIMGAASQRELTENIEKLLAK